MNEQYIAHRILHHLDHGAKRLAPEVSGRLRVAREKALARQRVSAGRLALAGGTAGFGIWDNWARPAVAVLVLSLAAVGWSYWSEADRVGELEEVDAALLSDDLPINAYLDRGFDAWVRHGEAQ